MYWVLDTMRMPKFIVHAITMLYQNNHAIIRFGSSSEVNITMGQGIQQGCPMSGSLWALLLDPTVRFLASKGESLLKK